MDTVGIYKITNKIDGKSYIGQSRNIEKRWQAHRTKSFQENDHSYNTPFYRAIRKYGIDNFTFEIIEECKISELNEKEKYWIQKYDTFFNGYNLTLGGDGGGSSVNKDNIIGIIKDLETTLMKHKDIAEKWNVSTEMVQGINTGRYWKHDREYPIQPKNIDKNTGKEFHSKDWFCIDCGKKITRGCTRCIDCEAKRRSTVKDKINRKELKNLIRTLPFTKIGEKYNVTDNAIRKWCDKYNLPRTKKEINSYSDVEWEKL